MQLRLLLILLLTITFSGFTYAQTLTGKVTNTQNEPVVGASVKVANSNIGTTTNVEGRYSLPLATGKTYTIEVSSVGYTPKIISDVEHKNGEDELNIILETKPAEMEGVVVTARATSRRQENTTALLTFQKNNTAVSSVIAADFIRRTPDKNTGEVLKRVSGASIQDNKFVIIRGLADRYNSAYINGAQLPSSEPDKKAFSFDVIPSQLIDNIIINKTATPDLTGEFAGGVIQVNTKDVPAKTFLDFGVSLGFNTNSVFKDFTSNKRNSTDWLGFDDGTRQLPNIPSSREGFNANRTENTKKFNTEVYPEVISTATPVQNYNLTYGYGKRYENGGSLGIITGITYRNSKLKYSVNRNLGGVIENALQKSYTDEQNRYATSLGGVFNITYLYKNMKVSWKNLFNQNFEDNYYQRSGFNVADGDIPIRFYSSNLGQRSMYTTQLEGEQQLSPNGAKFKLIGNFSYNGKKQPDLRTLSYGGNDMRFIDDESDRFFSNLQDYSYGGSAQLSLPFNLFNEKQMFKGGASTLLRVRDFSARNFRWRLDNSNSQLGTASVGEIFQTNNIAQDKFTLDEITLAVDKYFGVSIVNAGYLMFDNKLSEKVRLIWGARAENFQQFLTTKNLSLERVIVDNDRWDFLPSVNFVYNINTKNIVRLSGSQTLARPEFREVAPFSFYDYEQLYAVVGDTTLTSTRIYNADVRYEWYPKAGESISLGAFYKHFNDPIEMRVITSANPRRYQFRNTESAYAFGVELEARKKLDFISANLENFSIFTNITYIKSKVQLQTITGGDVITNSERRLQGQSPYLVNLGLQYNSRDNDISGTLLYNRIGPRISLVGDPSPSYGVYNVYENPRNQLDLQLTKKILKKRGELRLNIADIFNQPYLFYDDADANETYSTSGDRIFSRYKPGTTFTLGFNYSLIK